MSKIILFGEPMALFIADTYGPLEEVEHFTRSLSGAEVNVCIGLKRLGHNVTYLTRLGDDPLGKYILNRLEEESIETEFVTLDQVYRTGIQLKNKVREGDAHAPYYRKGSAFSHISPEVIDAVDFSGIRISHITGIPPALSESCRNATYHLVERANENQIMVSFDPNLRPALWENEKLMIDVTNDIASQSDIFLPGIAEGKLLSGLDNEHEIANFYHQLGVKVVIIKLGAKGAFISTGDEQYPVAGFKVPKVVDTVGAGDGFAVGVLSGILEGLSIRDAVIRGNAIGSIQVMHPSDNEGLPTRAKLEEYINQT